MGPTAAMSGHPAGAPPASRTSLDRQGIDLCDDLLARNHPSPGQELARDPLDAAAGVSSAVEQRDLHLRLGADDFDLADVVRRLAHAIQRHLHEFGDIGAAGAGADAEQAAIGEGPVKSVDRIGKAAGFTHLVPEPRGQPAAENMREEVDGVIARILEREARQPENDIGLFELARMRRSPPV